MPLRKIKKTAKKTAIQKPRRSSRHRRDVPASARRQSARSHVRHPKAAKKQPGELFEALLKLQARLRAPDGCPWDREQTHATLRTYLIEEAYEVLDAIESADPQATAEELGDLLLQVVFHAQLAQEAGTFDISQVITGIHEKMVRRHPHVFGNAKAGSATEVVKNWEELKAQEKSTKKGLLPSSASRDTTKSLLKAVPRSLPALLEAYELARQVSKVGFDWEDVQGVLDKLQEETREVQAAVSIGDSASIEDEVGDLLFVVINLARHLRIDPEVSLKKANLKFRTRFLFMEKVSNRNKKSLKHYSKEALEVLWNRAKTRETTSSPNTRYHGDESAQ